MGERVPTKAQAGVLAVLAAEPVGMADGVAVERIPRIGYRTLRACQDRGWVAIRRGYANWSMLTYAGWLALARYREAQGGGEG